MHFWKSSVTSVLIIWIQHTLNDNNNKKKKNIFKKSILIYSWHITKKLYWVTSEIYSMMLNWLVFLPGEASRMMQKSTSLGHLLQKMHTQFCRLGFTFVTSQQQTLTSVSTVRESCLYKIQWMYEFLTANILSTCLWTAGYVNNLCRADNFIVWLIHHQPVCWFVRLMNW